MDPKEKPLVLTRPKSPEEIELEEKREIAPKIRRYVNSLKLPMAVKGFFSALLDDTFMHCYGGSGKGKIYCSIKDLARRLRHNKDSITAWRDVLVRERLIWVRESWPYSEWRICAMCPPPASDHTWKDSDYIRGKAASLEGGEMFHGEQSGNLPLGEGEAGNGYLPQENENPETTVPTPSASLSEGLRHSVRSLPPDSPKDSTGKGVNLPHGEAKASDSVAGSVGDSGGRSGVAAPKVSHQTVRQSPPTPSEGFRDNKETPGRTGGKETKGGGVEAASPPVGDVEKAFKDWLAAMPRTIYDRELEKRKAALDKLLKTSADGPERQLAWRKLVWIHDRLDLGAPSVPAGKPVEESKPKPALPRMPMAKARALMAKAKTEAKL